MAKNNYQCSPLCSRMIGKALCKPLMRLPDSLVRGIIILHLAGWRRKRGKRDFHKGRRICMWIQKSRTALGASAMLIVAIHSIILDRAWKEKNCHLQYLKLYRWRRLPMHYPMSKVQVFTPFHRKAIVSTLKAFLTGTWSAFSWKISRGRKFFKQVNALQNSSSC